MEIQNCSICYLNCTDSNENLFTLDCRHTFHFHCLQIFFNHSEYYFQRCCYCTNEMTEHDILQMKQYFYTFKQLNFKCIYLKLDNELLYQYKDILNSNNYKLFKTCILYNNYYNFDLLFNYLKTDDKDVLTDFVNLCISQDSYFILRKIYLKYSNIITSKYIIDKCIQYKNYKILYDFINNLTENSISCIKEILLNSIISNDYDLFFYFKDFLKLFNIENINISYYFAIKHYNLPMIQELTIHCQQLNLKYNNIIKESCKKLNTNYFVLTLFI